MKHDCLQQLYRVYFMSFILQAGIFMGFAITSAVCGGLIIIMYGTTLGTASCQRYCDPFDRDGYRYHNVTVRPKLQYTYSYETKLGLAAVILTLGIIEFGTGIWVSIYLCVMKPCCIVLEVSFLSS